MISASIADVVPDARRNLQGASGDISEKQRMLFAAQRK
jgi:hypothetical protein